MFNKVCAITGVRVAVRFVLCCHVHVTLTRARVTEMANIEQLCNIWSQKRDIHTLDSSKLQLKEHSFTGDTAGWWRSPLIINFLNFVPAPSLAVSEPVWRKVRSGPAVHGGDRGDQSEVSIVPTDQSGARRVSTSWYDGGCLDDWHAHCDSCCCLPWYRPWSALSSCGQWTETESGEGASTLEILLDNYYHRIEERQGETETETMGNESSLPLELGATFDADEIKRLGKRFGTWTLLFTIVTIILLLTGSRSWIWTTPGLWVWMSSCPYPSYSRILWCSGS